ncbi:MAG: sorbosone dehydrogenase family protein [Methylotenera sp.]|nr:sorbosone dehydrogenase family protein [Methylotenera sp.]
MNYRSTLLLFYLCMSTVACANEAGQGTVPANPSASIQLPSGFKLNVFANIPTLSKHENATSPRMMVFDALGNLYVSMPKLGAVLMLSDQNHDGVADKIYLIAQNLNAPHGLAFVGEKLYVANQDSIVVLEKNNGTWPAKSPVTIVKNLPTGGHTLKSLKLGPDGLLYVNVGSSCNVCSESDPLRATILRYTTEGKSAGALTTLGRHAPSPVYASGLRNSQGFAWHPNTHKMFATNEGADNRSEVKNGKVNDALPPEHLNQIEAGKHYGWPYCWGMPNQNEGQFADPSFGNDVDFCKRAQAPALTFISHSTPIGITFLHDAKIPKVYKSDAIVALHGSWNRKKHSGYQLVRVKFEGDRPVSVEDFATGWLSGTQAWGRPVDVVVGTDGAIYVSDDRAGLIYRITYQVQ